MKPPGLDELRQALCRHAEGGLPQSLEAYSLAVALREVDPPLSAIPRILEHLPQLAQHAGGSVRELEGHLRALA